MKTLLVIILVVLTAFARVNLPANDMKDINLNFNIEYKDTVYEKLATEVLASQSVAEWQFIDFIVFKFACSERLEASFIAEPLSKWRLYKKEMKSCKLAELIPDDFILTEH